MTAYSTPEFLDAVGSTRATRTWTRVQPTAELNIRRSGTAAMVTTDNSIITSSTRKEYCVRRASRMLERAARCLRSAVSTSINLRQTSCVAWFDHFTHTIGSGETSALQEFDRIQQQHDAQIADLEALVASRDQQIDELRSELSDIVSRLEYLEA